jgi:hypothetical protein
VFQNLIRNYHIHRPIGKRKTVLLDVHLVDLDTLTGQVLHRSPVRLDGVLPRLRLFLPGQREVVPAPTSRTARYGAAARRKPRMWYVPWFNVRSITVLAPPSYSSVRRETGCYQAFSGASPPWNLVHSSSTMVSNSRKNLLRPKRSALRRQFAGSNSFS